MEVGGVVFFVLFSALASPGRFFALFLREYGLRDAQIGLVRSVGFLMAAVVAPRLNAVADRLGERELVCAGTFSASIAVYLLQKVTGALSQVYRFPYLVVVSTASFALEYPAYPMVCALSIAHLKRTYGHDAHARFGRDRLWGAVSWACVSVAFGALSDRLGGVRTPTYFGRAFFGFILVMTLVGIRVRRESKGAVGAGMARPGHEAEMRDEIEEEEEDEITENDETDKKQLRLAGVVRLLMAGGPTTAIFYVLVFVLRSGMSVVEGLLFLYFDKQLSASHLQCGLSVVVTVVFEIPMFAAAPWLLRRLGAGRLLTIGALAYAVRGLGYSIVPNAWWVLVLEPLHGVTFAAMHTAAVAFVAERSPPAFEATAQAVLAALENTACVVATAAGGLVMQTFGPRAMYAGAACCVLAATAAFVAVECSCAETNVGDNEIEREQMLADVEG